MALELVSETPEIYRAEYLAFQHWQELVRVGQANAAAAWTEEERLAAMRTFMAPRYGEGYVKGVHDQDAAKILGALLEMHLALGLLRYPTQARACAAVFWLQFADHERKALLTAKLRGYATMQQIFPSAKLQSRYVSELQALLRLGSRSPDCSRNAGYLKPPSTCTSRSSSAARSGPHHPQMARHSS